ncbi:hypothetical protein, partial [Mesorhizobium sp. M1C.F.Ca.ET.210.01.1.1]|uniref:hypothetical protein n=1 Tax=Mesorhizobium sp. M1C.F.Ca.ET.210.01.1.1 TaxID=2563930 RepID=UPI001AED23CB
PIRGSHRTRKIGRFRRIFGSEVTAEMQNAANFALNRVNQRNEADFGRPSLFLRQGSLDA